MLEKDLWAKKNIKSVTPNENTINALKHLLRYLKPIFRRNSIQIKKGKVLHFFLFANENDTDRHILYVYRVRISIRRVNVHGIANHGELVSLGFRLFNFSKSSFLEIYRAC